MRTAIACVLVLAWTPLPVEAGGKAASKTATPAEAIRKALNQKITLDYVGQSLQEAVNHLREKTKINFVLDSSVLGPMGFPGGPAGNLTPVHLKVANGKLRQALQQLLAPHQLTYVILRDSVVLTTEELGRYRQLRQRVRIDVENKALSEALTQLARETGANLVIDPAAAAEGGRGVTLQLDDTSLETAVRLLAEIGGAKSVWVGNVLFLTTAEKAAMMHRENEGNRNQGPYPPPSALGAPMFRGVVGEPMLPPRVRPGRLPRAPAPGAAAPPPLLK